MSLNQIKWPTVYDVASRLAPNGDIATAAEVLEEYNEFLEDVPFFEANDGSQHVITLRKNLPTPSIRQFNQGVPATKSTTRQFAEPTCMLEDYSEVDKALAERSGAVDAFRSSENKAKLQGFGIKAADLMLYGDVTANPDAFTGLAPRYYSSVVGSANPAGAQVLKAGGAGSDNTSIWIVKFGERGVYGIYPKGSKAGLQVRDLKEQRLQDANGNWFQGLVTHLKWDMGMAIEDYRNVVRIANIDVSDLLTASDGTDTSANLIKLLSQGIDMLPPGNDGRIAIYANQTVRSMLRVKMFSRGNVHLSIENLTNARGITRPTLTFMGYPVRRMDRILNTEAAVS